MSILVPRRAINPALRKKRGAWVFHALEKCRLSLSEVIVYSFRACQNEYQQQAPSRRQVVRGVGMGRDAIARADRALMDLGLLDCNLIPQEPPEGWFQRKQNLDPARHWRNGLTSWTKYVPRPECRMSLLTVCAWSYLAHCTGPDGLRGTGSERPTCAVSSAHRMSVQKVLATLQDAGLVQRHDGSWCPVLVDLDWLADKWEGTKPANLASKVRWVELPDGATVTIPTTDSTYSVPSAPNNTPMPLPTNSSSR